MNTYEGTLAFMYEALPVFHRIGKAALKPSLDNTIALCSFLGHPEKKWPSIHIAGTNGKGSSSHMLASILQSAGYKTGLYTSPHLKDFRERVKVNGIMMDKAFVVRTIDRLMPLIQEIHPSFFEITVALAFEYFAQQEVDIAVVEVGLGGRLDSTNIILPEVSLITNIGWDHMDLLGDTLPKIASEKAGIIKPRIPVVVSEWQAETAPVFKERAVYHESPLVFASHQWNAERISDDDSKMNIFYQKKSWAESLSLDLLGNYQSKNVLGVLQTIEVLNTKGYTISREQCIHGLSHVVAQTGLKGRWQILSTSPLTIADTAHNVSGLAYVVTQLKALRYDKLWIVLGMVKDKEVEKALEMLPKEAYYYFCEATIPRALPASELAEKAIALGLKGEAEPDVNKARRKAQKNATANDVIFIGGSTFVVAEIEDL